MNPSDNILKLLFRPLYIMCFPSMNFDINTVCILIMETEVIYSNRMVVTCITSIDELSLFIAAFSFI